MTRPALPAFERELRALARRAQSCILHAVHFQHGRAHEAVLAVGAAEGALRSAAATARANARTELDQLKAALDAWEHPAKAADKGTATQEAPASNSQPSPTKQTPAKPRRIRKGGATTRRAA